MWYARVKMCGITGLQGVNFVLEDQIQNTRQHVQQFLAVVLRQGRLAPTPRHRSVHRLLVSLGQASVVSAG
jgi:hypothetical protein